MTGGWSCSTAVNGGEVTDDLIGDMVEVLTSLCAGLYGRRSARNRAEKALRCAQRDVGPAGAARGDPVVG
jgi:putative resolvase